MPKLSVIVPVYNTEKYLRRCMDSIMNQTLKDIEIIIVDDGSRKLRPARYVALLAPLGAILLYLPNGLMEDLPIETKIAASLVWIPAVFSLYYNLKHAIIPDLDFGFIKAIKPYNILAVCLGFAELLCLTAWDYLYNAQLVITSVIFAVLCVALIIAAKKGAERWTI